MGDMAQQRSKVVLPCNVIASVGLVAHRLAGEQVAEFKEAASLLDKGRGTAAVKENTFMWDRRRKDVHMLNANASCATSPSSPPRPGK